VPLFEVGEELVPPEGQLGQLGLQVRVCHMRETLRIDKAKNKIKGDVLQ